MMDAAQLKHRDIVVVVLLSIFTFGIYALVWYLAQARELDAATGQQRSRALPIALIVVYCAWLLSLAAYLGTIFATILQDIRDGTQSAPLAVLGVAAAFAAISLAMGLLQAFVLWVLGERAAEVTRTMGREPTVPPALHFLSLAVNIWPVVGIACIQNDLNKARARALGAP